MRYAQISVRNPLRLRPAWVMVAAGLACTLSIAPANADAVAMEATGAQTTAHVGATYQSTLDKLNNAIQAHQQRTKKEPDSWLTLEWLANAYLDRARLTGQFQHYVQADNAMNNARLITNSPRNIALSRAELNYTLHRLDEVETDLQHAESTLVINAPTQRRIDALRADVALQQGRYTDALVAYEKLDKKEPSTENALRLANYYWQVNDEPSFAQWMKKADERVTGKAPRVRAWLNLQSGIADLSRGRYDEALAHYNEALALFPGYWLVEEHIAEIDVIQGRLSLAESKYRDLINRTESPMFRLALAEVLQKASSDGMSNEAISLTQAAKQQLGNMVGLIPESMAGHALEVSLQLDSPEKALSLAELNYKIRPNGESSVLLAQAYVQVGETGMAQQLLQNVLASPYRSPDLYATAGVVFKANGQLAMAEKFSNNAVKLKHDVMDDLAWLGH